MKDTGLPQLTVGTEDWVRRFIRWFRENLRQIVTRDELEARLKLFKDELGGP